MNATTTDVRLFRRFTRRCLATSLLMSLGLGCASWLMPCAIVSASDLPPAPLPVNLVPSTNRYHFIRPFTWDTVSNATGYQLIVRHSGIETQRVSTATNWASVSNLTSDLDNYSFTAIAQMILFCWDGRSNSIPVLIETPESQHAPLKLLTITDQGRTLSFEPTNDLALFTNLHPVAISRWDAAALLKPD